MAKSVSLPARSFDAATLKEALDAAIAGDPDSLDARYKAAIEGVLAGAIYLTPVTLAANQIQENAAAGTVIGGILNIPQGGTVTVFASAGGRFAINGTNLVAGAVGTDFEAATSHNITLRLTHPNATNSPLDTSFSIGVQNVFEQPALVGLSLSKTLFAVGSPESGTINGPKAGSTITAQDLPAGLTINGAARTWSWSGTGNAALSNIKLIEVLADSPNSGRESTIAVTVTADPPFTMFGLIGDSITAGGAWPGLMVSERPAGTNAYIRAAVSRVCIRSGNAGGNPANPIDFVDGDGGNSLVSYLTLDQQSGTKLLMSMIGTNDLVGGLPVVNFRGDLARYKALVNGKGMKFCYSVPIQPSTAQDGSFNTLVASVAELRATFRDPAVWSLCCDYYDPTGEHPRMTGADNSACYNNNGEWIHPNALGGTYMYAAKKHVRDSLLDQSKILSQTVYEATWPAANQPNLDANAQAEILFTLGGLAHKGANINVSVAGDGNPQLRRGFGGFQAAYNASAQDRAYNGDTFILRMTTGAGGTDRVVNLTIGAETRAITFKAAVPSVYQARFDPTKKSPQAQFFNSNRTFSSTDNGGQYPAQGGGDTALTYPTGYAEMTIHRTASGYSSFNIGLIDSDWPFPNAGTLTGGHGTVVGFADGGLYRVNNNAQVTSPEFWMLNDFTLGLLVHKASKKVWLRKPDGTYFPDTPQFNGDGTLHANSGAGITATNALFFLAASASDAGTVTMNAGATAFVLGALPANVEPGWR